MDFLVFKCCQCFMFQVHQSKKSKNWSCKLCGKKQSLLKVHFEGTSKECRKVVQDANMKKQQLEVFNDITNDKIISSANETASIQRKLYKIEKTSKWDAFKTASDNDSSDEESVPCTDSKQVDATKKNYQLSSSPSHKLSSPPSHNAFKRKRINYTMLVKNQKVTKKIEKNNSRLNKMSTTTARLSGSSKWTQYGNCNCSDSDDNTDQFHLQIL